MSKVRVIYKSDKTVSIIHPVPKSRKPGETEAAWLKRVFNKTTEARYDKNGRQINPLYGLPYDDVEDSELPDRSSRDAWVGNKDIGVYIDLNKADAINEAKAQEAAITTKILETQRLKAIAALKAEGKLPETYK